jgi:hypothetical protein
MNIHQIASELQEAALLENTEAGEYWMALVNLSKCVFSHSSDEFAEAFEKELAATHAWLLEHYEIVEVTETRTETRKKLRWREEE